MSSPSKYDEMVERVLARLWKRGGYSREDEMLVEEILREVLEVIPPVEED